MHTVSQQRQVFRGGIEANVPIQQVGPGICLEQTKGLPITKDTLRQQ